MRQFTNERGDIQWQPTNGDEAYFWYWTGVESRRSWRPEKDDYDGLYTGHPVLFRRQRTAARVERKQVKDLETRRWQAVDEAFKAET